MYNEICYKLNLKKPTFLENAYLLAKKFFGE